MEIGDEGGKRTDFIHPSEALPLLKEAGSVKSRNDPGLVDRIKQTRSLAYKVADKFVCKAPIVVGGLPVLDVLHDSGAAINCISVPMIWALYGRDALIRERVQETYWLPEGEERYLTACGGSRVAIKGFVNLPIGRFDGNFTDVMFAIYEDPTFQMILGTPALRQLGFTLGSRMIKVNLRNNFV